LWVVTLSAQAQPPDPKKSNEPPPKKDRDRDKDKDKDLPVLRLPDGTYLWLGTSAAASGERVSLTPQEFQKLLDQIEQLKKQLAARKTAPPSSCVVRGRVEKRGEQLVAVIQLGCTFRTTVTQSSVSLGGRRGFLVAASLDGSKVPILDTTEDGYALTVETPGDHSVTLDLEVPVTTRGAKAELGFEIGLPRAPITTLLFEAPGPEVKRVSLTTRTPDPSKTGPPELRRITADLKQLAARPGMENGLAVGPVDSLELTWEPPASAAQAADQVLSAESDITVLLTEGVVETTARIRLRGSGREWKILAPVTADLTAERVPGSGVEVGPSLSPVISKPSDANKPVWKIELPVGTAPADWVITAVTRQLRARPDDPRHRGPFGIGPFTVLGILRQTGTIRVTAGANQQLAFQHGPDLRRVEAPGPSDDEFTTAVFRLTTGPTTSSPAPVPLLSVESWSQPGRVTVRPSYRLNLRDGGWFVRAEVKVVPIRTELESVTVEVPTDWRGLEASPPELVVGVQPGPGPRGFWAEVASLADGGPRVPVVIRLASAQKTPFDLVLTATVPADAAEGRLSLALPRFTPASERDAAVTVTVPEGSEVRGEYLGWGGEFASRSSPLTAVPGPDGQPPRVVSAVTARSESGLARLLLGWNPYRPDLAAEILAHVTTADRQLDIVQTIKLRSSEPISRPIRFRGPNDLAGLKANVPLEPIGPGEWSLSLPPESRELTVQLRFALPVGRPDGEELPVALVFPTQTTRLDTTVSVWPATAAGRTFTTRSAGWRELPPEPDPERAAFPALTLGASGGLPPLLLEARRGRENGPVGVWVDKGLIQVWATDASTTRYRGQFLLRRWVNPFVEVRLPGPLAGTSPEFFRDGQRITPAVRGPEDGDGAYRIPLPPYRPGLRVAIEVRYQLPAERNPSGEVVFSPPTLPVAAYAGPVRWRVQFPPGTAPLLTSGAVAEFRWRPLLSGVAPLPLGSEEDLERWFRSGDEPGGDGSAGGSSDTLTAHQSSPAALAVYRTNRLGMVVVCSVTVFVLVLVLSRLPGWFAGPVVAVTAGGVGLATVFAPHPTAQFAGACQPGVAAAVLALLAYAAARGLYVRRLNRLPSFARAGPDPSPSPTPQPTTRNRPVGIGSSGSPAPTAAGG
jgi:hypothetical protein